MTVRVKTTAGPHLVGVTFPQTNFAPVLDLDQHFMRDTLQTGPTPGFTFFPHVGTLRIEGPFNAVAAKDSPSRRRIFVCRPTGAADEAACARKIVDRPRDARVPTSGVRGRRAVADGVLSGRAARTATSTTASRWRWRGSWPTRSSSTASKRSRRTPSPDSSIASAISTSPRACRSFSGARIPDDELLTLASQGRLKDPAVLERQVRRMLKDPRAEALAINFAGQWLNLRGLQSVGPLPMVYPDFDDPLRQAMRREVELLFDSIVREDRSIVDLLTADYTFVNERLAKHYGIPNIYGSQFRRVTLGPDMEVRRGLLGKGAFLTTTSKPERTSPVTRGKWIMTNILGMSPPDPPPDVPPLKPKAADAAGNAKEPTMRQKMMEHRVRADCIQCHKLMDPIGFALENFDGVGSWRTQDEGHAGRRVGRRCSTARRSMDRPACAGGSRGYSDQFVAGGGREAADLRAWAAASSTRTCRSSDAIARGRRAQPTTGSPRSSSASSTASRSR